MDRSLRNLSLVDRDLGNGNLRDRSLRNRRLGQVCRAIGNHGGRFLIIRVIIRFFLRQISLRDRRCQYYT